ncbi:hypothetical protein NDU88_004528 [Pleurodeles waltl]|uniref:Uncharacterized protein n=1 Tax=Pleurodeles waltl TaxID=8319 RepID=A0AAV7LK49_PLEWA|nr:hypothetical protein NDU88_004528 [Pleurodeles waltl]
MGMTDARQPRLNFDGKRQTHTTDPDLGSQDTSGSALWDMGLDQSIKAMFLDLKNSLSTIDSKIEFLTSRMNRIKERVDKPENCIDNLETLTSVIVHDQAYAGKHLLRMEKVLEVTKNGNQYFFTDPKVTMKYSRKCDATKKLDLATSATNTGGYNN